MSAGGSRAIVPALLVPLVPLGLSCLLLVPVYRANDDVGMNMLAAGVGFASEPTPFIMFSHHFLGAFYAFLYRTFPGVHWYHGFGVCVQYAASATIAWSCLRRQASFTRVVLVAAYFLVFGLLTDAMPHFTLTAAACATAAFLLWREVLRESRAVAPAAFLVFFGFWMLAALVRFHSAVLVFLLALPALAFHGYRYLREPQRCAGAPWIRTILFPLLGSGLLIGGLTACDHRRYAEQASWADFNETADLIGSLVDFGRGAIAPQERWTRTAEGRAHLAGRRYDPRVYEVAQQAAGWSVNDYDMLMDWFYADRQVYSAERLRKVLDGLPRETLRRTESLNQLRGDRHLPILLATMLLPCMLIPRRRAAWIELAGTVLAALALFSFLIFGLDRLPSWVYQPVFAFVGLHALVLSTHEPIVSSVARVPSRWPAVVVLAAMLGLFPATWGALRAGSARATTMSEGLQAATRALGDTRDQLYVTWGSEFPYDWILPSNDLTQFRDFEIYSVGADTRAPHNAAQLERLGIDDIYRAVYERPEVRVVSDDRQNAMLAIYVAEHHGVRIAPREIARFQAGPDELFSVYRFERLDAVAVGGP